MTTLQAEEKTENPNRPGRRAWWIVGGVLTAVAMLLGMSIAGVWIWTAASPERTDWHNEVYAQPVGGVDMDVVSGRVDLTARDGEDLEVRRDMSWKGAEPDIDEQWRTGEVFSARAECADNFLFWINTAKCEVNYAIGLPAGSAASVRTSMADVNVDGIDGELNLVTNMGDVDAQHLRTTATSVETSHGDITLSFAEMRGDVEVDASHGDVTILVPDDGTTYDVQFETDFGEPYIGIATDPSAEADYVITVNNDFGDLDVRYAP